MTNARLSAVVIGCTVLVACGAVQAAGPRWAIRLAGESRQLLQVEIDTRDIGSTEEVTHVVFSARFFDVNGKDIGRREYGYLDEDLPVLTNGHHYQRSFYHGVANAVRVSGTGLTFGERALGGKADMKPLAAAPGIPGTPDRVVAKVVGAHAQRPALCQAYASTAVKQQRLNLERGCNLAGSRWDGRFGYHYEWCYSGHDGEASAETEARRRALALCTGK